MKRHEFVKAAIDSGICTKSVAERYANTKSYNYDFDGYEDLKEASRLNERLHKPAHFIVNHFAGRMNDRDI